MQNQTVEELYKVRACDDQVYGPVPLTTLVDWVKDQRVLPGTWIYSESDHAWQKAEAIPALHEALLLNSACKNPAVNNEEISADELSQFPQFAKMSREQLEQVRRFGELCVAAAGTRIIKKGSPGDALYFVLGGEVRVRLVIGAEDKTLFKIRPGHFFGEMALFNNSPRSADVLAVTDTRLMRVTQDAFKLLIEEIPELSSAILYTIAGTMADRLIAANVRYQQDMVADFCWR
jgi:hypothetical protein